MLEGRREDLAAFWLTLDAINFGSGWFPTLRKPPGRSGYFTIASGVKNRFLTEGLWNADELAQIDAHSLARILDQDPEHELMALFAASLQDLGAHISSDYDGSFTNVIEAAGSATALVELLSEWDCFADTSLYDGRQVPFLKRAQIAAADLVRAAAAAFGDIRRLTIFADNLVPHVLRLDGVLSFSDELASRIEAEELIDHGSREEIEIRACALHAVEEIVAIRPTTCAAEIDQVLWLRGQQPRYKASPRHRSRCTAY